MSSPFSKRKQRNIAAPSCVNQVNHCKTTTVRYVNNTEEVGSRTLKFKLTSALNEIYLFKFEPLEDISSLKQEKYIGPGREANWVLPEKLLVGAYPASNNDNETFFLLASILKEGINEFVCLQQEYLHSVSESMWRSGKYLRPYIRDARLILKNHQRFIMFQDQAVVEKLAKEEDILFLHFPIRDCGITDDDNVLIFSISLIQDIMIGKKIYLHCWGGHGRTGTIVSIMLGIMYQISAADAMNYCQAVHDLRQFPVIVGSPQTQSQRDQVERVLKRVESLRSQVIEDQIDQSNINHHSPSPDSARSLDKMLGSPTVFHLDLLHQI